MVALHDAIQPFFHDVLDSAVNGQLDRTFLIRQYFFQCRFEDGNVITVCRNMEFLHIPFYFFIEDHFNAIQSLVVLTDKADELGRHLAIGIVTVVFIIKPQPLQLFIFNHLLQGFVAVMVHGPFQPDKGRIPLEPFLYLAFLDFQIRCEEMRHFAGSAVDHSWIGVQGFRHFTDSQHPAVPVQDGAPRRLDFPAFFRLGIGPP